LIHFHNFDTKIVFFNNFNYKTVIRLQLKKGCTFLQKKIKNLVKNEKARLYRVSALMRCTFTQVQQGRRFGTAFLCRPFGTLEEGRSV